MVAGAQFMNQLVPFHAGQAPVLIAAAGERARAVFIEFFSANIRILHPSLKPANVGTIYFRIKSQTLL
jgi:hypothetical protein